MFKVSKKIKQTLISLGFVEFCIGGTCCIVLDEVVDKPSVFTCPDESSWPAIFFI